MHIVELLKKCEAEVSEAELREGIYVDFARGYVAAMYHAGVITSAEFDGYMLRLQKLY